MPSRKKTRSNVQASLDMAQFWRVHDSNLSRHVLNGDPTLSHDLYRGMPTWFNAYYDHFQRRVISLLLSKIEVQPGQRALDLGCGTGRWSGMLLSQGAQVFGIDLGLQALSYAHQRWEAAHFTGAQLPYLCFAPDQFDLAISVTVLQHLPRQQQPAALKAIAEVLKPGGHLLACETTDAHNPSAHIFGNSLQRWLEIFTGAGYQVVGRTGCEYLPHVKAFQWARRAWQRTRRGSRSSADVSAVANLLQEKAWLALPVWLAITVSYPLEYLATWFAPPSLANLACFALRKV